MFALSCVVCPDIKTLSIRSSKINTKANDLEYFHPDQKDLKMFLYPNMENKRYYSRTEITDESS